LFYAFGTFGFAEELWVKQEARLTRMTSDLSQEQENSIFAF
jgi:hypothetical protein